jgi:type III restriction enzyme
MTKGADRRSFKNEDLVLKVSTNIDPKSWDESRYEAFIDELCQTREYQKDAIRTTLRYLLGTKYGDLRELARENFQNSDPLRERYGSWIGMEKHLQFPDQLSCSIDLATGTGKSYVLYGLATILLAEGAIDRALVLCPSNTIEAGLLEKFRDLASNQDLRDLLPVGVRLTAPKVINASETIAEGSICVENYHAILQHVKSSIRDSLKGRGARVAVFSDEVHHVVSGPEREVKRWKEFLLSPDYAFRIMVGVSGTCYVGDDYFADVIARYSLRQAIEERFVKSVQYVWEMPDIDDPEERWQLIHNRHNETKRKLRGRKIRPLTIIVTKDIKTCKLVAEDLQTFLRDWEKIPLQKAQAKVLPVTSASEHQVNLATLKTVDSPASPVEWIASVSMLSEGWDVKNVFQIVPHEKRAFDSKLLIAQVLGRGLRIPIRWSGEQPIVTVFNHAAWSGSIKHLVDEILEIERRLSSVVVVSSSYNFDLHSLDYDREEDTSQFAKKGEYRFLDQGFLRLPTQIEREDISVEFARAVSEERAKWKTRIVHKTYSIEEVAEALYRKLEAVDSESGGSEDPRERTSYSKKYTPERLVRIVQESLKRSGNRSGRITEDNRQKFLQALGPLRRKVAKRVVYRLRPTALRTLSTRERQAESCSAAELRRHDKTIFYGPGCESTLSDEQREFFAEVQDEDGEFAGSRVPIANGYDFKTPLNLAIAEGTPERKFLRELCERDNAQALDAWLKSTRVGFYEIEYAWKKGEHPKRGLFSPDFFVKKGVVIFVIEIKDDTEIFEPSPETQKKYEYATDHFDRLNSWLAAHGDAFRYQLNFLTPRDFSKFFQKVREDDLKGFKSELDVALERARANSGNH